jgi:hypothetical protein
MRQLAESPIFDAPVWSENEVSCPQCGHERNEIGDSVLWVASYYIITNCCMQSTESPIFDASFWSENGVSCPQCGHERNKIGDSVLWLHASMFEPRNVVLNLDEFIGQLNHPFDAISRLGQPDNPFDAIPRALLFRQLVPLGDQSLARSYVV